MDKQRVLEQIDATRRRLDFLRTYRWVGVKIVEDLSDVSKAVVSIGSFCCKPKDMREVDRVLRRQDDYLTREQYDRYKDRSNKYEESHRTKWEKKQKRKK